MPITAQPSCGRASIRMPATLRPSIQTSFGHLIRALDRGDRLACLADGERDGERQQLHPRRLHPRQHDSVSARPGGAVHVRPWRPRPAV